MSLKIVRRQGSTFWYVRGAVFGQTVFESTRTGEKGAAESYRIKREKELWAESVHGKKAVINFSGAAASYLTAEPRQLATINYVDKLIGHFKEMPLAKIGQESLDPAYRAILQQGVHASPATKVRGVITPLRAVLEHAAVMGWCSRPAFKKPRIAKTVTNFLLPQQVDALIAGAAEHIRPLLTFLAGTGCRMSEALELKWSSVDLRGKRVVVWQKQGNERRVDLCPRVAAALAALPYRDGHVFRPINTKLLKGKKKAPPAYGDSYRNSDAGGGQIKRAWSTACRIADLPGGWRCWSAKGGKEKRCWASEITPHDLRHTWASWHYCVYKDPLKLRGDGGWGTLAMVARYAHMIPDGYQAEIEGWWAGMPAEVRKEA